MMRRVQEVNNRLDTIPSRPTPTVTVTCITCHRGVNRPVPLANDIIVEAASAAGADSAIRAYRTLRDRFGGIRGTTKHVDACGTFTQPLKTASVNQFDTWTHP